MRNKAWWSLSRGIAMGVVVWAGNIQTAAAAAPAAKPNILFIMADDLGYGDLGCYGRVDIKTPHLDSLATNGVRFLQAYANSAVCSATRAALMTGRYQYRLRVGLEEPLNAANLGVGLDPAHPTLPSLLKRAGYRTTLVGKWHLGVLPKYGPLQSGYDQFYGFRSGAVDYFTHANGAGRPDLWEDDIPVNHKGYMTELLGNRAVDVVNAAATSPQPFFLSLHFSAPHWPWEGPGDEAESKRLAQPGSGGLFHYDGGSQRTYRQMVEAMDTQVGRVLEALRKHGLTENTLVVFTSDNGGERFSQTWPFSGRKTELLEGGLRVPAIAAWPAHLPAGVTNEQVAMTMDWLPTLLAAAGTEPDAAYPSDGLNLLPFLAATATPVSRTLFWRYKANHQRAVRSGDLKVLTILNESFLFNLADDPLERANLKRRQELDFKRLSRAWYDWNATMLPEIEESFTGGTEGSSLAEHYGRIKVDPQPDVPRPPED